MTRYKYYIYNAYNKLVYNSHFDYEDREFTERLGLNHLKCFQLGGDLLGGYIEIGETK